MFSNQRLRLHQTDRQDRRGMMAALDATQCLGWFDADSRLLEANVNLQALLGWPVQDLTGMTYRDLCGGEAHHQRYFTTHWTRILTTRLRSEERELKRPDGSTVWCALTYAPLRNTEGDVRRVLAIVIDLSPWNRNPKEGLARIY